MSKYIVETEQFRFSNYELHLLRSRFPYKKISFEEIDKITIGRGIRIKRALVALLFGLILFGGSIYVFLFFTIYGNSMMEDGTGPYAFEAYKGLGQFFIMGGFLISLGAVAIFQAVVPTWVLKVGIKEGSTHVLSLKKLIQTKEVLKLARFYAQDQQT